VHCNTRKSSGLRDAVMATMSIEAHVISARCGHGSAPSVRPRDFNFEIVIASSFLSFPCFILPGLRLATHIAVLAALAC
jgi:hypothetical protein